ncbi:MAG: Asp23/Gls24 family envelope stress response protein [Candidatus Ornithomonoglobus sp.]
MGNIKISVDVVSTIAGIAASEIEGVSCMYTSFAEGVAKRLGARRNASNGVKVDMGADSVSIDLYIVVEYGVKIPELAWSVQENVKNCVETMTGLSVSKVNIHIEGISFDKEDAAALEAVAEITE